jgi:hypothetical protein
MVNQPSDGAWRHRQLTRDLAIGPAQAALLQDLIGDSLGCGVRAATRPGGPVEQAIGTFLSEALQPLISSPHADTGRVRCLFDPQALNKDAINEKGSTAKA